MAPDWLWGGLVHLNVHFILYIEKCKLCNIEFYAELPAGFNELEKNSTSEHFKCGLGDLVVWRTKNYSECTQMYNVENINTHNFIVKRYSKKTHYAQKNLYCGPIILHDYKS